MKKQPLLLVSAALLITTMAAGQIRDRERYLLWMQETLPECPEFNAWQKRTGILPPDFNRLPSRNLLPDPFTFLDGSPVSHTEGDWERRREEIKELFQQYVLGHFPPKPEIGRTELLEETAGDGYVSRTVRLSFGPEDKGSVRVSLTIPTGFGRKSYPVVLSANLGGLGDALLSRGYISAGFAGSDFLDDTENLRQLYPGYDFAALPRRAWVISLVLDYLGTVPEVDMDRIAVYGYSRDGKMATIAAAFDERISALVAGSTGVGGLVPWRYSGERNGGESIESTTRMFPGWFIPQLRFFSGREDRLPVDANLLLALIAPRAVLMEWGLNDEVASGWAQEQTYDSVLPVYEMYGAADRLSLLHVPGFHGSNDLNACTDFLDIQFGRSSRKWHYDPVYSYDFGKWKESHGRDFNISDYPVHDPDEPLASSPGQWNDRKDGLVRSVKEMLGSRPVYSSIPYGRFSGMAAGKGPIEMLEGKYNPGQLRPDIPAWVIGRKISEFGWTAEYEEGTASKRISFGPDGIQGDLYYPEGTPEGTKLPTVIWLHGYHYPLGYMWVYRTDIHPILALVKEGFAVLAFDQTGFGRRYGEYADFYDRYPEWSRLGKMVDDVSLATTALEKESIVDSSRISVFGFAMGGTVGLYAAALDSRISNVVSVCGFTPMRTDTSDKGTSGMTRYSHLYGMQPRLGLFEGNEERLPYDFADLIALTAPRGVLIVQPSMDRDASPEDVRKTVEKASAVFGWEGAADRLVLKEPEDVGRMGIMAQINAIEWLKKQTR